ncbi:hypothetical protein [Pseudanabaena sp. FACHB-2040]|uniref:hypothetical protein n=1 Tax=Pseudanabaena sp. FACHB-2040 TaxID=2692859 RepID=UPI0016835583|nr:hypothetical protein [Pseudanabaena sp. FACHB-2040]
MPALQTRSQISTCDRNTGKRQICKSDRNSGYRGQVEIALVFTQLTETSQYIQALRQII